MSATPTTHPRPAAPPRVPWLPLTLLVCALLALAGGLLHRHYLSLASALLLLVAWLPYVWRRHSVTAVLVWLGLAALLLVPALFGHAELALMALPVVFLGAVSWLFARTLRHGEEPLIARFIRMIEGDARLDLPGVRRYARGVTMYWAALLAALALLSLLIALCAQPGGWLATLGVPVPFAMRGSLLAWYPEAGCWMLLLAGFVGEYLFRRWHLRAIPHPGVRRFVTQIVRRWPTLLRGGDSSE
ncbi:MAG: xanthomonadin biosynthesis protein [Rhodanobacteraceae bacterium]